MSLFTVKQRAQMQRRVARHGQMAARAMNFVVSDAIQGVLLACAEHGLSRREAVKQMVVVLSSYESNLINCLNDTAASITQDSLRKAL